VPAEPGVVSDAEWPSDAPEAAVRTKRTRVRSLLKPLDGSRRAR